MEEKEINDIISKLITVMTNEHIPILNKKILAELCETSFHFLAIIVAKRKKVNQNVDIDYSISQVFSENILAVLVNSKNNKNASIGAILVVKSYLSALVHDYMVSELHKLFLPQLIAMNNEIMGEILKVIHEMTDEDYIEGNEKLDTIVN